MFFCRGKTHQMEIERKTIIDLVERNNDETNETGSLFYRKNAEFRR